MTNKKSLEANDDLFSRYRDLTTDSLISTIDVDDLLELFKRFLESDEYLEYLAQKALVRNNLTAKV